MKFFGSIDPAPPVKAADEQMRDDIQFYAEDELQHSVMQVARKLLKGEAARAIERFNAEVPKPRTIQDLRVYLAAAAAAMVRPAADYVVDPANLPRNYGKGSGDRTEQ